MRKVILYIISLVLFLTVGCTGLALRDSFDSIMRDYALHRYQEASVGFSYFIRGNPESPYLEEAHFYLGKSYLGMKNYYFAGKTFQEYLKRWPDGRWNKEAYEALTVIDSKFEALYTEKNIEPIAKIPIGEKFTIHNEHIRDVEEIPDTEMWFRRVRKAVVISGEVENRGNVPISNLRIRIVSYDFYRRVLNSSFAYVGRVNPQERVPFSVIVRDLSKDEISKVDYDFLNE